MELLYTFAIAGLIITWIYSASYYSKRLQRLQKDLSMFQRSLGCIESDIRSLHSAYDFDYFKRHVNAEVGAAKAMDEKILGRIYDLEKKLGLLVKHFDLVLTTEWKPAETKKGE